MVSKCRLCGATALKLCMSDGRNSDLHYYQCQNCSMWNYDLSLGTDQTQYTEEYVSPRVSDYKSNVDVQQSWKFLRRFLDEPGRMLDIGCGNGCLLYLAREAGWQVRGIELSASAATEVCNDTGIEVDVANFLEYDNPKEVLYDVVVLRHVLEHLPDAVLAMTKIGELLKPGGLALLEFPNTRSVSYLLKRFLKKRGLRNKKYAEDWRPGHCNEFCRKAFKVLLDKTGFELIAWRTYSSKPLANAIYRVMPIASKARVLIRRNP